MYNNNDFQRLDYCPDDYTDVGEAALLAKHFKGSIMYVDGIGTMVYSNGCWSEAKHTARTMVQDITAKQLAEASQYRMQDYEKFALRCRTSTHLTGIMIELQSMLSQSHDSLDSDPLLLNTPDGTYDLRKGLAGKKPHDPNNRLTHMTSLAPNNDNIEQRDKWLRELFCGDEQLIDYVQMICGLCAIGKVDLEAAIIAYGCGRNGKSTFFNLIQHILGTHGGMLSAEALTTGCRQNVRPELAELRGKRMVIAPELREGARLDDSMLKKLCSTDKISAEKKYQAPIEFSPSHTLIVYTNHLPNVSASDDGTWRRLIVVPFKARFDGSNDIKNYAKYLYDTIGGSVLSWIIEGAQKAIVCGYNLPLPDCVVEASKSYRDDNDWLSAYISERCQVGKKLSESSSKLYTDYRLYCAGIGEPARTNQDFYRALEVAGFKRFTSQRIKFFEGLEIIGENLHS